MGSRLWDRVRSYNPFADFDEDEEEFDVEDDVEDLTRRGRVGEKRCSGNEIVFRKPVAVDDAGEAAERLKARHPVIVSFESADHFEARRMIDFLSGVAFALDGHMEKLGETIFLFTPKHVPIDSVERSVLVGGGIFVRQDSGF